MRIRLSASAHGLLAALHEGQGDPLYALVSRTTRGRETDASADEIAAAIKALRWWVRETTTGLDEGAEAENLADFLEGKPED